MILKPMVRNNVCINAHPAGCSEETSRQIAHIVSRKDAYAKLSGPKAVLVIGCSTGYGLATRIASAFGFGAATFGVSYEKDPSRSSTGTPGYYNNFCFDTYATSRGLVAVTYNGDAFSQSLKLDLVEAARNALIAFDLVVYSLASPVRIDPVTNITYRSVLKPIGSTYRGKTVDVFTRELSNTEVSPATESEVLSTIKVMGGEDWDLWIKALAEGGVLAPGATTVAYSYIGPRLSWPIYREGTIGRAKAHLEATASTLVLSARKGLQSYVSINKALVTRASSVIPVIPLYISILFKVMKERGIHEDCIQQIDRMFREKIYGGPKVLVDEEGRIRLDELEMGPAVQAEVESRIARITPDNLEELADVEGFRKDFLRIHGFEVEGIDYDKDVADLSACGCD